MKLLSETNLLDKNVIAINNVKAGKHCNILDYEFVFVTKDGYWMNVGAYNCINDIYGNFVIVECLIYHMSKMYDEFYYARQMRDMDIGHTLDFSGELVLTYDPLLQTYIIISENLPQINKHNLPPDKNLHYMRIAKRLL